MKIILSGYAVLSIFILSSGLKVSAQESTGNTGNIVNLNGARPDIPGELGFDLGFLYSNKFADTIATDTWRSIYFSGFYKYEILLGKSNFSVLTGLAVSPEKYRFEDNRSIVRVKHPTSGFYNEVVNLDTADATTINKSNLTVTYLEIPLEFRIRSNIKYPSRAFFLSVGGKVGYAIDSKTKVKFREESETKVTKEKQSYDIEDFRFGVTGRLGFGPFNLFYYYSLTQLFEKNKGVRGTEAYPMTFGISLHVF